MGHRPALPGQARKGRRAVPKFDVPAEHSADTYFEYVARQGFEKRRPRLEALRAAGRLKHDLAGVHRAPGSRNHDDPADEVLGLLPDRLGLHPLRQVSNDIPVGPGRGSAAGSLVGYAMAITDIDPLQYGLLFERFLNPERISMPDIDIDFCMNRRGEVIQYVTEKYGREQVAQIITFNTLGARAAIKDVGRVLDMSFADVGTDHQAGARTCSISALDRRRSRPEPGFAEAARKGPARGRGPAGRAAPRRPVRATAPVHAAGVVISPEPLKTAGAALPHQPRRNCHPVRHERARETVGSSRWTSSG